MSPYLLLGFLFAGILHVLISPDRVAKFLGKKGFFSSVKAAALGVPLPLCSCGVIPTGISFYKNGAGKGATNAFLISTPQTGVDSIILTYSMMGPVWTIARPIIALITGVFGGVMTDIIDPEPLKPSEQVIETRSRKLHWFPAIFKYAFIDFLSDISRPLLLGIFFAIIISVIIPPTFFTTYMQYPILNMLIVLAVSVPLYVCATGSIPIATALLLSGVSPGAVLVFLMAGPATNIATITVLWRSIGKKATLTYLFSIIVGALFFGILIDYVLPSGLFTSSEIISQHTHSHGTGWPALISAIILIALILFVEFKKIHIPKSTINTMSKEYIVEGMTCNHCKAAAEKSVRQVNGVIDAQAFPSENKLIVEGTFPDSEIKNAVEKLGYVFKGSR